MHKKKVFIKHMTWTGLQKYILKNICQDFPYDPAVKNPPYNAGDESLIPGGGTKIPHAGYHNYQAQVLQSPCFTTRQQLTCSNEEPRSHNKDSGAKRKEKKKKPVNFSRLNSYVFVMYTHLYIK